MYHRIMDFKTSNGTVFKLPSLAPQQLSGISPRKFLAKLLVQNYGLDWASFNRRNIFELTNHVIMQSRQTPPLARQLLDPFENQHRKVRNQYRSSKYITHRHTVIEGMEQNSKDHPIYFACCTYAQRCRHGGRIACNALQILG